jgi:hypothetical protein
VAHFGETGGSGVVDPKERRHLEDVAVDGRIKLKGNLQKQLGVALIELVWRRMWTIGGIFF